MKTLTEKLNESFQLNEGYLTKLENEAVHELNKKFKTKIVDSSKDKNGDITIIVSADKFDQKVADEVGNAMSKKYKTEIFIDNEK